MGVQFVGSPADIGAGALPPPDQAFGFEHFQRPSYRAAPDIKRLRKRSFGRQLAVGARPQKLAQLFQRVGGILPRIRRPFRPRGGLNGANQFEIGTERSNRPAVKA